MDEQRNTPPSGRCQGQNALPREILPLVAAGQRRLLISRRRRGLPDDPRSLQNLRALEQELERKAAA